MNSKDSDEELIFQYKRGNDQALRILIERHLHRIYSFVYQRVKNKEEAEDITQEIFIKVWRGVRKFKTGSKFDPWLFTIAKNTLIDFFRKKKFLNFSDLDSEEKFFEEKIVDSKKSPEEDYRIAERKEFILEALSKIPPKYRQIIEKHYYKEFSLKEIAKFTKESPNTVKSRHKRALQKLKIILRKII